MKSQKAEIKRRLKSVAPARERGLKLHMRSFPRSVTCRSREGAWIEINAMVGHALLLGVAPARERGLKFLRSLELRCHLRRSREGAWIEILARKKGSILQASLPRGSVD